MRVIFGALLLCFVFVGCKSDSPAVSTLNESGDLNWITIEQAESAKNKEGKFYLVDMYTSWCGWCKVMDRETFTNPEVKALLDEHFYVVKMDAESKTPITFKGKTYEWQSGGRNGINMLAYEFLGGRQSYPTMVYLDDKLNKISAIPGFKRPDQFLKDLQDIIAQKQG